MIKNDQHRGKLQHCSLLPVQHKLFPSWNVSSNKHYYSTNTVSRRQLTGPLCNVVKQHHLEVALRMTHDIFQWMCLFFLRLFAYNVCTTVTQRCDSRSRRWCFTSSSKMYEGSSVRLFSEKSTSCRWVRQNIEMVSGRLWISLEEALHCLCMEEEKEN